MVAGRVRVEVDAVAVIVEVMKSEMKSVTVEADCVTVIAGMVMVLVEAV